MKLTLDSYICISMNLPTKKLTAIVEKEIKKPKPSNINLFLEK